MNTSRATLRGRVATLITGAALAATLSACSATASPEDSSKSVSQAVSAIKLAEQEVGGTAFEVEQNGQNGWEVDVVKDTRVTEVHVNLDGDRVEGTKDEGTMDADDSTRLESASITIVQALTATTKENTGTVDSIDLDRHHVTTLSWNVELTNGSSNLEIAVDAATGKVLSVDPD